jgi:hypothetical protein
VTRAVSAWAVLGVALAACEPGEPEARPWGPSEAPLSASGANGTFAFELEPEPSAPRVGEVFQVVTTVRDAHTGAPVEGATFFLDATMPHHGHGMMTVPEHRERGDGRYESRGMKLHMHGRWTFDVRAEVDGRRDEASLVVEQPPR